MTIKDINVPEQDLALPPILQIEQSGRRLHRKKDGSVIEVQILTHDVNYRGQRSRYVMAQDVSARRKMDLRANHAQPA
jgi:hypothetical protein